MPFPVDFWSSCSEAHHRLAHQTVLEDGSVPVVVGLVDDLPECGVVVRAVSSRAFTCSGRHMTGVQYGPGELQALRVSVLLKAPGDQA